MVAHIEELEGLTTKIYNHALGDFGEREKKRKDWQQMLAQGESFPAKKKGSSSSVVLVLCRLGLTVGETAIELSSLVSRGMIGLWNARGQVTAFNF